MRIPKFSTLVKYHILLGILLIFIPTLFIVHLYVFFAVYIFLLFNSFRNSQNFIQYFLIGFLYFPLSEAVGRLHSLDPFVPWEFGKYMAIFFVAVLLFSNKIILGLRFALGTLLILTTFINGNTTWKLVFFNAIITLSIMLMGDFFDKIKLESTKFLLYLRFALLPLIVFLFSSLGKLQNFKAESLQLNSNFILDEIPSNQIATYMGLGFFLVLIFYKFKVEIGLKQWQKLILAFSALLVGIISFSRGGIVVGILGLVVIYFFKFKDLFTFRYAKQILIVISVFLVLAYYVNTKSNGNLILRYQGETEGTLIGGKENGLNNLTTNRFNIMTGDISTFSNNLIFGVSTGKSKEYRLDSVDQLSHVEFSRLLAENGIFGLLVCFFWVMDIFIIRRKFGGQLKLAIFLVGFATTFHGAMRTSVPLVFMLFSLISIVPSKINSDKVI